MKVPFYKYEGAGNDFIIIDQVADLLQDLFTEKDISLLCNRRFGIGADGLMLIKTHFEYDFEMVYYNSDGKEGSMCGNGGRCLVAYAARKGIAGETAIFTAADGPHKATVVEVKGNNSMISLQMRDVQKIKDTKHGLFLDTGSPHLVIFEKDLALVNVFKKGKELRNAPEFKPGGTNVNFAELKNEHIYIRTYERGVENETLACGTGVTAVAIAAHHNGLLGQNTINVSARGGDLKVAFENHQEGKYRNIWLEGPAKLVFKGEIDL